MKKPCINCPFRNDETGIKFASQARALEIARTAFRHGFPCHTTAEYAEPDEESGAGGYVFGEDSQHCAGYLIMRLKSGDEMSWPGIGNDDVLLEQIRNNVDLNSPVFADLEEFIEANTTPPEARRSRES